MKSKVSVGLVNLVAGIFVLSCPCYVYSADPNFDISLGNVTYLNGEEPIDVVIPSFENDVTVTIKDLPTKTAFVVFQVHSFPHKVTVKPMAPEVTDLGIDYSFIVHPNAKNLVFLISSPPTLSTAAMAVATAYGAQYAVPGGCAMESVMRNSPSLAIEATNSTVKLFAQRPALSIKDTTCQGGGLSYEFYFKFAYNVETSDDYFEQIKTMLTYQRITAKATKASYMGGPPTQRIFARYSGIRVFYGLAVKNLEVTTMYPALGYLMEDDAAWGPKIVIVAMFFMGVTLLSYGHSHFPLHLFFSGLVAGHHVCYAGCVLGGVQEEDILGWALFGGLVIGGAVLLIWITWAMPGVCIIVPIISAAYLFACTIFYLTSGNVAMFGGPSYWGVFTAVLVLITSLFFIDPVNGTWAAFATIGGYLIIRFLNYLFGGQLHHIVENPMRRLTEDGFDEVITTPPLQTDDVLLFCCWMLLITLGFLRHKRHARGRAPFPPPPRLFPTAPTSDERRPLLPNEAITIPE